MKRVAHVYFAAAFLCAASLAADIAHSQQGNNVRASADAAAIATSPHLAAGGIESARLHVQLRAAIDARAHGATMDALGIPAALLHDDQVLVEVRFAAGLDLPRARNVLSMHGGALRNSLGAQVHETWMPLDRLEELAREPSIARILPARLAQPLIRTSEGVAAGNANYWQTFNPSYTGTGITIALIDAFNKSTIASLQGSSDWPANARVSCIAPGVFVASSCTGSTFGSQGVAHGNATMELVYDVAPGASYRAYDTVTVGDWYNAILDAANVNASGVAQGAVKANVISVSLSAPIDGIGDGTAQPGSIAEAAGYARNRGVLVVNAAGNERENHWGGAYAPVTGNPGFHSWSGSNTIYNFFGSAGTPSCIPSGTVMRASMYWNNWVKSSGNYVANHDYGLYLYKNFGSTVTPNWNVVAQSDLPQTGGIGNTPEEIIALYTTDATATTSGCAAGAANYAIVVVRNAGTTATDNLQIFADAENSANSYTLNFTVAARSLVFPADSPNVLAVAAMDVANASSNPQEPFSSEGPVLASGGGIPVITAGSDPNLKPDLASFDHVSTVTFGASNFYGTSASTAQVAGMAALFMQRFGVQTSAANLASVIVTPLRAIAITGTNDLGATGKDYQYGNGRLRFQKDASLAFVQQPTATLANSAIAPPITIGIYDAESKLVPYTLFDSLNLAIANDPNGGSAVLSGGGSASLSGGIATYATAKIDQGGSGYALKATASAATAPPINLSATSNPFNITTGAPAKLAFTVQPASVVAGVAIAPAIKVSVQDSNGNVVNGNNSLAITLRRSSCNSVALTGGGPLTVTNGVAVFSTVALYTSSSATLTATASGVATATSSAFTVSPNADYVFRGAFETCVP